MFKFIIPLLLVSSTAFGMTGASMRTDIICEEGYKFLIVWSAQGNATSPTVTQIMRKGGNGGPMQPMTCDE